MSRLNKTGSRKFLLLNNKTKSTSRLYLKSRAFEKRNIIHHLVHPDYILFDWEFFSRELEFE